MRPFVLAVCLVLSPFAHAAVSVRVFTNESRLNTSQDATFFMHNDGTEAVVEAVVEIELNPGLEFRGAIRNDGGWICGIELRRKATCRLPSFDAGARHTFVFNVNASRGGHFNAHVRASGRNLPFVSPLTFNISDNTTIVVTTAEDFGEGTLRAAIEAVNDDPLCGTTTKCTIRFAHPMTIAPSFPLPPLRKCNVEISGGAGVEFPDQPKSIVISGENALWGNGLEVRASCPATVLGVTLHDLVIHSWPWNGIYFEAPAPHGWEYAIHNVNRSFIGMNAMGLEARPNRGRGIVTDSPYERLGIYNSIISGNGRSGVALFRGERVNVIADKIGINRHHQPLGNGASGVFSSGVPVTVSSSIIAYNAHAGVALARNTFTAIVNYSELHSNGGLPIDWGLDDRTLPDDESDRVLNAPRILEATYDAGANVTYVRATVDLRPEVFGGGRFTVETYIASSARGDVVDRVPIEAHIVEPGQAAFTIPIPGDYRGRMLALQTFVGVEHHLPHLSSEISEAVTVR